MACLKGLIVFNNVEVCGIPDEFVKPLEVLEKSFKLRCENEVFWRDSKFKMRLMILVTY